MRFFFRNPFAEMYPRLSKSVFWKKKYFIKKIQRVEFKNQCYDFEKLLLLQLVEKTNLLIMNSLAFCKRIFFLIKFETILKQNKPV
jgi:hypothetical protein